MPWLLLFVSVAATAQPKNNRYSFPWGIHLHDKDNEVVDTTRLIVEYALCADDLTNENTFIDWEILEVGARMSKFYSYFVWRSDSIIHEWHKRNPHAHNVPTWRGGGGKKDGTWTEFEWGEVFIQDDQLSEYCHMPNALTQYNAWYTEERPQFGWQLGEDTLEILGYSCQKATCHWRGRDYIAWFTTEIPLRSGPWKFSGLPGLIMEIQDKDGIYRWTAVGVENGNFPIMELDRKKFVKSTRPKVWKLHHAFNYKFNLIVERYSIKTGERCTNTVTYEQLEKE